MVRVSLVFKASGALVALAVAAATYKASILACVTGTAAATAMLFATLMEMFEDKDAKEWRATMVRLAMESAEREQARLEQDKMRLEQDKVRLDQDKVRLEQDKARLEQDKSSQEAFEQTMAGLGFAVYHLQSTAQHSPAAFGNPPARLLPVDNAWTQTESSLQKAGCSYVHAQYVAKDLEDREEEVSALRRRTVSAKPE